MIPVEEILLLQDANLVSLSESPISCTQIRQSNVIATIEQTS